MSIWPPDLSLGSGPVYLRLADAIERAVATGNLRSGERLPSHREMSYQLGISIGSVAKAYGHLIDREVLGARVGHGTVVMERPEEYWQHLKADTASVDMRLVKMPPVLEPDLLDRTGRQTMAELGESWTLHRLCDMPPDIGYEGPRRVMAARLARRGVPATAETVTLTVGAQEAMLAVVLAAARRKPVLMEELTLVGLKNLCATLGVPTTGLAMDERGLIPEALDAAAKKTGAKLLVTFPCIQIPTTVQMDETRRRDIVEVLRSHDMTALEIETFAPLLRDTPPPMAGMAPERIFHISSLSNDTMQGLRVAVLHAPATWMGRVMGARHATVLAPPPVSSSMARIWEENGWIDEILAGHRAELAARHEIIADVLSGLDVRTRAGAPMIWLPLRHGRAGDLVDRANKAGVRILSADKFMVNRAAVPEAVRLAISSPLDRESLIRGIAVVRDLMVQA